MTVMAAWAAALPAFLAALLVLWAPGMAALAPLRLGGLARAALAGVVGVVSLGASGAIFGALGVPFAAWQVLVPALLLVPVAALLRTYAGPGWTATAGASRWPVPVTWLVAVVVIAVVAFGAVPEPERISQTYDNVFHLAAISHILDGGDASSFTLRTLIETDRSWSFYPSGWHTLVAATVQLSGAGVPTAVNAVWIAVCAAVWLPGVAWLAQVLVRGAAQRVALVALPLGASFAAMPYALLTWGTLYPTFLATALLPAAVAAPVSAWRRADSTVRPRGGPLLLGAAGTAVALVAVCFAQPRVLVTWALLVAPFVLAALVRSFLRARLAGGRTRRVAWGWFAVLAATAVAAGAGVFAYLVYRLDLFGRPLQGRLEGPQAKGTQTVLEGLWQVLAQSWPVGVAGAVTFPAVLLATVVLVGLVVAARTRGMRWIVVAYVLVAVLFALAAGSDDVFAKLMTAAWYKDRYRLSSALPVLGVALGTLGILAVARRIHAGSWSRMVAPAAAWVVAASAVLGMGAVGAATQEVFRLPQRGAGSEVVSQAQIDFLPRVAEIVPEGQRLLGDPWDGSALSAVFGGPEPVFPHVNGQWDAKRLVLAQRLQDIDTDPAVCAALDDLGVGYVLYHPHEFGGGDPAGNHFAAIHAAVEAGLFTPVASDGDSTLYRIDQCRGQRG